MEFEIAEIEEDDGLVSGLVRSGGRDLQKIAERYMETPNKSCPYAGGSGNLCPVESWIAKNRGEVPGGDAGDWGLVFSIRDPALLAGLRDGTHSIEITKSSTGAIDFDVSKSIKYTKVNKNMSTANEMFNQLVENRMAEIRSSRSDLSEDELREKAVAEILEVHPEFASESVEKGVREFQHLVDERVNSIRKSASAPRDIKVLKALASTEISRERPDLMRAVMLQEQIESAMPPKQTVAKTAPQQPMGPAAREMDRLVKSRMAEIRKSAAAPRDEKILKAMATTQISRERPELMRMVLNEERVAEARLAYGGRF
ncbi:hypothetical protein [Methanothrix soehngenii]|uniref:hypothetical protein n=1 Tax=Methanothrix soehngenii TaxID=2223 RepID=UPI002FD8FC9F